MKGLRIFSLSWRRYADGLSLLAFLLTSSAFAQNANDGFDPDVNDRVFAIAMQPDGKIIVGGEFTAVSGIPRTNLARLNVDGSLDVGFNPGTEIVCPGCFQAVSALAVQGDGRILVGGDFTVLNGESRTNLGRLNLDGTLDAGFNANAGGSVLSLLVLGDGKILVAGGFNTLNGQPRTGIGRLNADGSLDASFDAGANDTINNLVVQPDGRIVVGGDFTQLGGQARIGVGRLNADGSLDTTFNPGAIIDELDALALQADGKVLVGGDFAMIGDEPRAGIGRLNADGSLDNAFNPGTAGSGLHTLVVQPDGKILVGGFFTELGGQALTNIGRLNPDGSLDSSFKSEVDSAVNTFVIQPDGKILVGGWFTTLGGMSRNHLGRLYGDGSLDATLDPGTARPVAAIAVQVDGKIVLGGPMVILGGQNRLGIGRLNADGSLDLDFDPTVNQPVVSLAVQTDGKILVGGSFTLLGGKARKSIGRLNADGTVDDSFDPGTGTTLIRSMLLQADGKILVGNWYPSLIARLNPDGSLDTSFTSSANGSVNCMALQGDGKLVLAGSFTMLNGQPRSLIGRLNADGSLDMTFNPGAGGTDGSFSPPSVQCVAVQADGRILVGGWFTTLGGQPHKYIGRLNSDGTADATFNPGATRAVRTFALFADGRILLGGQFTSLGGQPRSYLGRLFPDGSLDTGFISGVANDSPSYTEGVWGVAVQADGKIAVAGNFGTLGGQARNNVGRLIADSAAQQYLAIGPAGTMIWMRSGSAPEVEQVTFGYSADGANFVLAGVGRRILGGWELAGVELPVGTPFFLRAHGRTSGGQYNGSSSLIESVAQFWRLPPPFLSSVQVLGGGALQFSFTNTNTTAFTVLAGTNVSLPSSNWTMLGSPVSVGGGLYQFTDPAATNHARRFYQLRSP